MTLKLPVEMQLLNWFNLSQSIILHVLRIFFRVGVGVGVVRMTLGPVHHTVVPQFNKVLDITNNILSPSKSQIYGKEPQYNKTLLQQTNFACSLALRYIEVQL